MDISGINIPEPCYGLGCEALAQRWVERESAQIAAGMSAAAQQTKMMRRELQEAANLVVSPDYALATQSERVGFLGALREIVGRHAPRNKVGTPMVSDYDMIWASDDERAEAWRTARGGAK